MANIIIRRLTADNQADLNRCDNSFTVDSELCLHAEDGHISYTVRPVTPYVKRYGPEVYDAQVCGQPDHAAWLAYADSQLAGQILVHENWNRLAIIWDIAVDPPFRRQGVGRRLIEQAILWTRERGLPGVMLETQNINVAACRLYESCGFVLGGFDGYLYRGVMPGTRDRLVLVPAFLNAAGWRRSPARTSWVSPDRPAQRPSCPRTLRPLPDVMV